MAGVFARPHAVAPLAPLAGGRTRVALARLDLADHGRTGLHERAVADLGARQQRRARADDRALADRDVADDELVAVEPMPGEIDLRLDRAVVAKREHPGDRGQRVQVDALADLRAEQRGEHEIPACRADPGRAARLDPALGEPQAQVHRAAAFISAGPNATQERPRHRGGEHDAADRGEQDQREHNECGRRKLRRPVRTKRAGNPGAQREPRADARPGECDERE